MKSRRIAHEDGIKTNGTGAELTTLRCIMSTPPPPAEQFAPTLVSRSAPNVMSPVWLLRNILARTELSVSAPTKHPSAPPRLSQMCSEV